MSLEEFLKNLSSFEKGKKDAIIAGDLLTLQEYTNSLSINMVNVFDGIFFDDDIFKLLSNSEKAEFIRSQISPVVLRTFNTAENLSYSSLQSFLKEKGLLFAPAAADPVVERLKDIIGGGLRRIVNGGDFDAGINVFKSGFEQVVNSAPRTSIINTSVKVFDATGEHLEARRITQASDACDFCVQKASQKFYIKRDSDFNGFHDYCRCRVSII